MSLGTARLIRGTAGLLTVVVLVVTPSGAAGQRRGGRFGMGPQLPENPSYDGAFRFCRIVFRNSPSGDGNGWWVDYPRADLNLSFRLSELTTTLISRGARGEINHAVLHLTDDELFRCPFIMMTEPGGAYFDENEAARLREYLLKGGFLWADDFWGEYAWNWWLGEIRKVLPENEYPVFDLPVDHPMFHLLYGVPRLPQIPSINFWLATGGRTSERGADSAVPHARAIAGADGHVMVVMTHNTDFGDAFERENDDREYFNHFASDGYAFGINVILYAMTH